VISRQDDGGAVIAVEPMSAQTLACSKPGWACASVTRHNGSSRLSDTLPRLQDILEIADHVADEVVMADAETPGTHQSGFCHEADSGLDSVTSTIN
jgi:hypothetical protein